MRPYRVLLTDYAWPDLEIEQTILAEYDAELVVAPNRDMATLIDLAGAALDVQEREPPDLSQPPYNDPRVIVTPHAAFYSTESVNELRRRVSGQVGIRLSGGRPENVANPESL